MVTSDEVKRNLSRGDAWMRLLFLALFGLVFWVASWVLAAVVVVQAGWSLLTTGTSRPLGRFGASLAAYLRDIALFVTYNTDDMPFPFDEWPDPIGYEDEGG